MKIKETKIGAEVRLDIGERIFLPGCQPDDPGLTLRQFTSVQNYMTRHHDLEMPWTTAAPIARNELRLSPGQWDYHMVGKIQRLARAATKDDPIAPGTQDYLLDILDACMGKHWSDDVNSALAGLPAKWVDNLGESAVVAQTRGEADRVIALFERFTGVGQGAFAGNRRRGTSDASSEGQLVSADGTSVPSVEGQQEPF